MGCGASGPVEATHGDGHVSAKHEPQKVNKVKDKAKKERKDSSSSTSSSSSSSEDERNAEGQKKQKKYKDPITKSLLKEFLGREIDMLTIEISQPEVVLKQLLDQKSQITEQLVLTTRALEAQQKLCMREYQDLTNLQQLIQQKAQISQETWDKEQSEYVAAFNKHKQLEESLKKLQDASRSLDINIKETSNAVKRLLKLRKHQDHILVRVFDGGYGSQKEAQIEEYVDKLKEHQQSVLNTKTQWNRALDFTKQANLQYWRAIQVWSNMPSQHHHAVKMQYCSYVANYLNAAHANSINTVKSIQGFIKVPYYTDKMLAEVQTSMRNAYAASQPQYYQIFLQWLWYYQQSSAFLEQWIQKTLKQTIEGDLIKVNGYLTIAESDLRAERKRLILEKVKEKFGDEADSEVAEQESEVNRLTEKLKEIQSVAVQTSVATVDTGSDSGIGSDLDDKPPPAPGSSAETSPATAELSEEDKKKVEEVARAAAQAEAAAKKQMEERIKAEEEAKKKSEEEEKARKAKDASLKRVEEAKNKVATLDRGMAQHDVEAAQKEAEEAEEAARKAKEDFEKAEKEREEAKKAEEARIKAEEEAREQARIAKEKEAEAKLSSTAGSVQNEGDESVTLNFNMDLDSVMDGYKNAVEQYEKKKGSEEARMDLDLQAKLRERRKRRRQHMKEKLEEQKRITAESNKENEV